MICQRLNIQDCPWNPTSGLGFSHRHPHGLWEGGLPLALFPCPWPEPPRGDASPCPASPVPGTQCPVYSRCCPSSRLPDPYLLSPRPAPGACHQTGTADKVSLPRSRKVSPPPAWRAPLARWGRLCPVCVSSLDCALVLGCVLPVRALDAPSARLVTAGKDARQHRVTAASHLLSKCSVVSVRHAQDSLRGMLFACSRHRSAPWSILIFKGKGPKRGISLVI